MTILSALVTLYDRMQVAGEAPRPGFSAEKIGFAIVLRPGQPPRLADRRDLSGKKPVPVMLNVPAPPENRRGRKLVSASFWDPSPYALGVSADSNGGISLNADQAKEKFDCFREHNLRLTEGADSPGLQAFHNFLESWKPSDFENYGFSSEALKKNIVFEFDDGDRPRYVHDLPEVADLLAPKDGSEGSLCLVTGKTAPVARLHPSIKGVMGAQSSGASLVSFNNDAYQSFGKSQGDNAPVSEQAAFAYGAALNALLEGKSNKSLERYLRIGETTVTFWVETPEAQAANWHEMLMGQAVNPPNEASERNRLRAALQDVASGQPADPKLDPSTTVYMLGLAPNAARLSVRFWHVGAFGDFARNMVAFWDDLHIEGHPDNPAWRGPPAAWSLLNETAIRVGGKSKADTIPPLLGGEVMRAVLAGQPLPRSLLSAVIARVRADGDVSARRAAICKAVINRALKHKDETHFEKEMIPVSLDPENTNPAYRLGRLFAVLERAQTEALPGLNATIKDRFFAAASATPARVFPLLVKNATHHLAVLKKGDRSGLGHWLEKEMGLIWVGLSSDMPRSLNLEDQGRFIAGYYHQRWTPSKTKDDTPVVETEE